MDLNPLTGVRAIFFDFMGTCLDWHTNIVNTLPGRFSPETRSKLAIAWREAFFEDIHASYQQGLASEDIDVTHARLLKTLLAGAYCDIRLDNEEQENAVEAWHTMTAWPDVAPALARLRDECEVFVLANGTTRLQLDLARSSGLQYDMMFSSQLLGHMKPDSAMYEKGLMLVGVKPQEALMVAAHAYDLRAAKMVGMKTAYVRRWTEDTIEDMEKVREDVDRFFGGTGSEAAAGGQDGQLTELADMLCGVT